VPQAWKDGVIRLIPKAAAKENPAEPGHFRPIALTSCIGKVFSSILKHRWLSFMVANRYMDRTVQKAFIPGVPGCIEHSTKLAAALHEAHFKHRSITVCWLDLANAYGSVHHDLIHFALQHYNAPAKLRDIVNNLYCGLQVLITTPDWVSCPIPFRTGVYQGDPFSVVIFNTVMCTMADSLKSMQHLGYKFSGSQRALHLLQYADDTCLMGDGPASCKKLLEGVERWLDWSGMRAKVPKCHSMALQASTSKTCDPKLCLYGQPIHFIGNQAIRFLGTTIQVPSDPHTSRENLSTKLKTMLEKVDAVPITCHQKLLLQSAPD
jgi:hypothetical protein